LVVAFDKQRLPVSLKVSARLAFATNDFKPKQQQQSLFPRGP
jgi:hypothetical protein